MFTADTARHGGPHSHPKRAVEPRSVPSSTRYPEIWLAPWSDRSHLRSSHSGSRCERRRVSLVTVPSVTAGRVKFYPLDESGNRRTPVPCDEQGGKTLVKLDPDHKTLWYEVEVR